MRGDFISFSYGDYYSDSLKILKVSDGSRYNENLTPPTKDTTIDVERMNRSFYIDSNYTSQNIDIQFAYDSLTEDDIRELRDVFRPDREQPLVFDERPYKAYLAKVQNPVSLSYVVFDEDRGRGIERIYKGEGRVSFILFDPFAVGVGKYLSDFPIADFPNKADWASSTRMKETKGIYDGVGKEIKLFNAGDKDTDLQLYFKMADIANTEVIVGIEEDFRKQIKIEGLIPLHELDLYVRINNENYLIEGCNSFREPTGTIYNKYIKAGNIFMLSQGEWTLQSNIDCDEVVYYHRYF